MNKQIKALKMAIAEIEGWIDHAYGKTPEECANNKAIKACKEALAEAEKQEPVGKMCLGCGTSMSDEKLEEKKRHNKYLVSCCPDRQMVDVYTHPTTWQSLSDDEITKAICLRGTADSDWNAVTIDYLKEDIVAIARAIEQALKEKNYG